MEPQTPEPVRPAKDTYHITYGIALIVIIILLNVIALDIITGPSILSSFTFGGTTSNSAIVMPHMPSRFAMHSAMPMNASSSEPTAHASTSAPSTP